MGATLAVIGHGAAASQALWHVVAGVAIGADAARIPVINSVLFNIQTVGLVLGWGLLGVAMARARAV